MNECAQLIVACLISTAGGMQEADRPVELDVLDQLVGTCKIESTTSFPGRVEKQRTSISRKCSWILGRRFLQSKDVVTDAASGLKAEVMQLLTYDAKQGAYRHWFYTDTGQVLESSGSWDERSKSFTLETELEGGMFLRHKGTMKGKDAYAFTNTMSDRDGKVLMTVKGRMERVKPVRF